VVPSVLAESDLFGLAVSFARAAAAYRKILAFASELDRSFGLIEALGDNTNPLFAYYKEYRQFESLT